MRKKIVAISAIFCMAVLILDTKTVITGAQNGIVLCLQNIIPSLLPFCVLSKIISSMLLGKTIALLKPIQTLTRIPKGSESILVLSFVCGYPLGAQCIDDAYYKGYISLNDARRMLAFTNNAGPAFIFGILTCLFPKWLPLLFLYCIHILSAIAVGIIIPGSSADSVQIRSKNTPTIATVIDSSIKTMSQICIWIVVFKIVQALIDRWLGWILSPTSSLFISGILELANGCISLQQTDSFGLRFILSGIFLAFGGCCITLQTISVTKHLPLSYYLPGKLLQAAISGILSAATQYFIFRRSETYPPFLILMLCLFTAVICTIIICRQKNCSNYLKNVVQ